MATRSTERLPEPGDPRSRENLLKNAATVEEIHLLESRPPRNSKGLVGKGRD